jgi:molecular chaperone DnaK
MQAAEQSRLVKWLEQSASRPLREMKELEDKKEPAEIRRTLERIDAEVERIEAAVERIPSIGLVTDRGAGN